ncbi:MAG: hypothetical protein ACRD6R_13090 [Candidatus Polarisedimenticolia bacterium]
MRAALNGAFPWRGTEAGRAIEAVLAGRPPDQAPGEELRLLLDRASREAVAAQVAAGLDLVTDGLARAFDPAGYPLGALDGVRPGPWHDRFPGSGAAYRVPVVEREVAWKKPVLAEDYLFAAQGCPRTLKPVLTGPFTLAKIADDRAYHDPMSLAMALAIALNQELRALQAAGASFIQIDEPSCLDHKDEFPLFTRIWEVLGRGVTASLCLHLPGGDVEGIYPGITRMKRLACLSLDLVAGPRNLPLLATAPLPDGLLLGLGVIDGREAADDAPEAIVAPLRGAAGLPPHDRVLLGTASGLEGMPVDRAAARLRNLARAARSFAS